MPKQRKKTRRNTLRIDRNGVERIAVTIFLPVKLEARVLRKVGILIRESTRKPCNSVKSVCEELLERALS